MFTEKCTQILSVYTLRVFFSTEQRSGILARWPVSYFGVLNNTKGKNREKGTNGMGVIIG